MMSDDDVTRGLQEHMLIGCRAQAIEMGLLRICKNPNESQFNAILHDMEIQARDPKYTRPEGFAVSFSLVR